jgi:anti-sigma regulatory factor (Ser/Thr protein kinase)
MEVIGQSEHRVVPVTDSSQPAVARMTARDLACSVGFDETDAHRVGIVATELATNLVKHTTGGGEVLVRSLNRDGIPGIELLALDRGRGMTDVQESLRDGHSTTGSSGNGLGAIRRLSEEFDIFSTATSGTAILSRMYASRARMRPVSFEVGAVSVAKSADEPCGDCWAIQNEPRAVTALVADGLGHGLFAAEAARAAVAAWVPARQVAEALSVIHDSLRHTRGAAGAVMRIDGDLRVVRFAGVGNIAATIVSNGHSRQAVSHNGTLGHQARHFREFSYPWDDHALLVMCSDGLTTHWSLDGYDGLARRHPAIVAGVLYRDFSRGRDDVTVLVCRQVTP